jgi:hypothetical protein
MPLFAILLIVLAPSTALVLLMTGLARLGSHSDRVMEEEGYRIFSLIALARRRGDRRRRQDRRTAATAVAHERRRRSRRLVQRRIDLTVTDMATAPTGPQMVMFEEPAAGAEAL